MAKQRIEYIDAMRGFTMILVVYSHICNYCLGDKWMGWNDVFFLFRLPCFFFISGWLFDYLKRPAKEIVKHKFMVQIVPTVIFLLLLAPPPLFFSRLGATKGGYWFTFALFEFFLLRLFSERYMKKWGGAFAIIISASAFCYDIYYNRLQHGLATIHYSLFTIHSLTDVLGFLSFITWRYYLFFYIGTWVKQHFETFIRCVSQPAVIILTVAGFAAVALIPHTDNALREYLIFAIGGILGHAMVFTAFRTFAKWFSKEHLLGRSLQYIGTRTLDLYLLHYFVLPRFLILHSDWLRGYDSKPLEFLVAMSLALIVVAICLLASYVIRLSPFLGHYLFGVKYERQQ